MKIASCSLLAQPRGLSLWRENLDTAVVIASVHLSVFFKARDRSELRVDRLTREGVGDFKSHAHTNPDSPLKLGISLKCS